MNVKLLALSSAILAIFSVNANEANPTNEYSTLDNNFEPYFYLGGRVGWANFDDACSSGYLDCDNDTFGYGAYTGYQWTDWFSLELGLTDYGTPEATYTTGEVKTDNLGVEISAKFNYNVTKDLELYTRVGASYLDIDKTIDYTNGSTQKQSSNKWRPMAAVGLEYPLSESLYIRGEYQFVDGIGNSNTDKADLHFVSLGLTYRFGQGTEPAAPMVIVATPPEPVTPKPAPVMQTIKLSGGAFFSSDSSTLNVTPELQELTGRIVNVVTENDKVTDNTATEVKVYGYTDSTGSAAYNQKLSERRAQAVADYLIQEGVNESQVTAKGFGEKLPVATNMNAEGRAKNRRVEIKFQFEQQK